MLQIPTGHLPSTLPVPDHGCTPGAGRLQQITTAGRRSDLLIRCRAYLYLKQQDPEAVNATVQTEAATREEGVPLQWTIATEISNSTTFMVRTDRPHPVLVVLINSDEYRRASRCSGPSPPRSATPPCSWCAHPACSTLCIARTSENLQCRVSISHDAHTCWFKLLHAARRGAVLEATCSGDWQLWQHSATEVVM
jgi:hypothetical protein